MPLPKNVNKGGRPTTANLNRVLPWQSVRQALEIPGTSKGLPETVTCPLCRGVWLPIRSEITYGSIAVAAAGPATASIWFVRSGALTRGRFEAVRGYRLSDQRASYLNQGRAEQYERIGTDKAPRVPRFPGTCCRISTIG